VNQERMEALLEQALDSLFGNQANLFDFTAQTKQTEWNLGHHLACEVQKLFRRFDCDIDVIKTRYGRRRPDIIIHRRGTNERNLLVIETKYQRAEERLEDERDRIRELWFQGELRYLFGAVVVFRRERERCELEVLENPEGRTEAAVGVEET
jgi:hypothetical protein